MKKPLFYCLIAGILCSPSLLLGQETIYDDPHPDNTTYVRHYEINTAISLDIDLESVFNASSLEWYFCEEFCSTPFPVSCACISTMTGPYERDDNTNRGTEGMDVRFINNAAGDPIVRLSTTGFTSEGEYFITIEADDGANSGERSFRFLIRRPLDLAFVVDKSGSMACPPPHDCSGGGSSRWEILRGGVQDFLTNVTHTDNSYQQLGSDRYGVVYFSSTNVPSSITDLNALAGMSTFNHAANGVLEDMNTNLSPGGATSIGDGLVEVINNRFLSSPRDSRKVILLITDGEQNMETHNWVWVNSSGLLITQNSSTSTPTTCGSGDCTSFLTTNEVYPISAINLPSVVDLYDEMSKNGVSFFEVTEMTTQAMQNVYNAVFQHYSPHYISVEDRMVQASDSIVYQCNGDITRLSLKASFDTPAAGRLEYEIKHNGRPVTSLASRKDEGGFYTNFYFDFQRIEDLASEGEWTFIYRLKGTQEDVAVTPLPINAQITLSAVADDHNLDLRTSTGKDRLQVGDHMNPTVQLSFKGRPVTNATATATILAPGADLQQVIANHTNTTTSQPDATTCALQRYYNILENEPEKLAGVNNTKVTTLTLTHQGNGEYAAGSNQLKMTGVYKVLYRISADIPGYGRVQRSYNRTVNVRFGDVKVHLEDKRIVFHKKIFAPRLVSRQGNFSNRTNRSVSKNGNTYTLKFRPAYRYQTQILPLGPGYHYAFHIQGGNVQQQTVLDNCDGSYSVTFISTANDPLIQLGIMDQTVYAGPVSLFDKSRPIFDPNLSLNLGWTFPLDQLETLYKGNLFMELDFNYQFSPELGVALVPGIYGFRDNFHILGTTAYYNGSASIFSNRLLLSGGAGYGVYSPKNMTGDRGYSLRLKASLKLSNRMTVAAMSSYFKLDQSNYAFWIAGLGANYQF